MGSIVTEPTDGGPTGRRRWRRWLITGGVIAAAVLLAAVAVAGWAFSSAVLVPDHSPWSDPVDVEGVGRDRIVLARSDASERPGYYGLVWNSGHAVVGPVIAEGAQTVTRRLRDVRGYLVPGAEGAGLDTDVYSGSPRSGRGLPFEPVLVHGELGPMPAWLVPGRTGTWAIVVHGINADPQVGLRIAPALHRLGLPTLMITYRDDLGAPPSPDGLHHQGLTEWRDLAAAVRYALAHGARRVVLVGYSMGGALIGQFMQRSELTGRVAALVLDAPALDWRGILSFNAEQRGLPSFAALPVEWAIDARINPSWDSLDLLDHPDDFRLPILLFHGEDDQVVPIEASRDFAAELPGWVTFFSLPEAGHTQSWNVDPALYERRLRRFLLRTTPRTDRARPRGSGSTN